MGPPPQIHSTPTFIYFGVQVPIYFGDRPNVRWRAEGAACQRPGGLAAETRAEARQAAAESR
jgi:hypothetical protein